MRRTLLPFVSIAIAAAIFAASASARPVSQLESTPPEKVIRYWSAERMRGAVPVDRASRPVPAAKPSKGGGGSTTAGASTEVPQPYPSAHGKVFFTSARTFLTSCGLHT